MSKQIKAADATQCKCWTCGRTAIVKEVIRARNTQNHTNIVQVGWRRVECPWCPKANVPANKMLDMPDEVMA